MVRTSQELMAALSAVRDLEMSSWCIGAGAIRSLVWDHLHGYQVRSTLADVDVVYFDMDAESEQDSKFERQLQIAMPGLSWEVTNQANIHHWFLAQFSQVVSPLASLTEGIATWPEYATCVGVTLCHDDDINILAPHGLSDLFSMVLRHNPIRATKEVYLQRVIQKKLLERWPLVSVFPD
jgi:hypothetical protein